jgi:HEAT repeat protein
MPALALLLALFSGDQPMDWLLRHWGEDEAMVRDDISREIVDRWREWDDEEMVLLDRAAGDPDPEVAGRARRALTVIRVRRRIDGTTLAVCRRIILEGSDEERISTIVGAAQSPDLEILVDLAEELGWRFRVDSLDELMKNSSSPVIRLLLPYFEHPDPAARLVAISRLMPPLGMKGLRFIEPMLRDESAQVRMAALVAVGQLKAKDLLARVLPLIDDEDGAIRSYALETILSWEYPIAAAEIVARLPDPDSRARASKIGALGARGSREHVEIVAHHLDDPEMAVRQNAVGALAALLGRESFDAILPLLHDGCAEVRTTVLCAVWALGASDVAGVVGIALPFVRDPNEEVSRTAARIIAAWDAPLLRRILQGMLGADDPDTRLTAISLLEHNGEVGSTLDLERLLLDPLESIRFKAFCLLQEWGPEGHLEAMTSALADPDLRVRRQAVSFITATYTDDPSRFGNAFLALLDDPVEETQYAAIRAVFALGAVDRLPALARLLEGGAESVREGAAWAIGEMAGREDLSLLVVGIQAKDADTASCARRALCGYLLREGDQPLLRLMECEDDQASLRTLGAAGSVSRAERIVILASLLDHAEESVRKAATDGVMAALDDLFWMDP